MFILDTNVVSEFMRDRPHSQVLAWLDDQLASALFVTAITEAEIRTGVALLPRGERQRGLAAAAERAFRVLFSERILNRMMSPNGPLETPPEEATVRPTDRRPCRPLRGGVNLIGRLIANL